MVNGPEILISLRDREGSSDTFGGSLKIAIGRPDFAVSIFAVGPVDVIRPVETVRDSFIAAAVLQRKVVSSITANAVLRKPVLNSFTADAVIVANAESS